MSLAAQSHYSTHTSATQASTTQAYAQHSVGSEPSALAEIYDEAVNISVWQRTLQQALQAFVADFVSENPSFQASMTVTAENAMESLREEFGESDGAALLSEDIAELVDMFCCLFDLERVGLRLSVLSHAMCPRFHVDRVPCRLVTTYHGVATDWLPNTVANRAKLGHGSGGLPDHESGLFIREGEIQSLNTGDVALLKGELWEGNEGSGLIHRSPSVDSPRLLMTLDFNF